MHTRSIVAVVFGISLVTASCNRKPMPQIAEKKPTFERQEFRKGGTSQSIALVSETECEISDGKETLLGEYSREGDKLRVVLRMGGAPRVIYYIIRPRGLEEPDTYQMFLRADALAEVEADMHKKQKAQAEYAKHDPADPVCQQRINEWLTNLKDGGNGAAFWMYPSSAPEIQQMTPVSVRSWRIVSNLTKDWVRGGQFYIYLVEINSGPGSSQNFVVKLKKLDSWRLWWVGPETQE